MKNINDEKYTILRGAAQSRLMEVMNYQINIDNFRLAIEKIEKEHTDKPHLVAFAGHLRNLMQSNIEEQDKERVMLEVIEQQLAGE